MAAVAASLAAFLAGCGLPGLPGGLVTHDPSGQEHEIGASAERHLGAEWAPKWQSGRLEIAAVLVKALTRKSNSAGPVVVRPPVPALPAPAAACGLAISADGLPTVKPCSPPQESVATAAARAALRPRRSSKKGAPRRVQFDLSQKTEHEITPYAEVYGVHPRDFNFARGRYAPAACFVDPHAPPHGGCSSDSDEEDEDDALGRLGRWDVMSRRMFGMRQVPPHLWFAVCVLAFLIRVFGIQVFLEMCPS